VAVLAYWQLGSVDVDAPRHQINRSRTTASTPQQHQHPQVPHNSISIHRSSTGVDVEVAVQDLLMLMLLFGACIRLGYLAGPTVVPSASHVLRKCTDEPEWPDPLSAMYCVNVLKNQSGQTPCQPCTEQMYS
jgi:hypothetical protein